MKSSTLKKTLALFLTLVLALSSVTLLASAAGVYTPTGDFYKISETQYKIAPGIAENRVIVNKASGTQQEMVYAVSVDAASATTGFLAGYADYNGSKWKMQSVRDQAKAAATARNANIVVAVNADIFNMSTGEPAGVLVMNGNIYQRGIGRAYFGITKSGEVVIGDSLTEQTLATLQEAVSGFYMIVQNGRRVGPGNDKYSNVAPKTCVGMKADGSVVIVTVDGRNYPISSSLGDYDLATIMLDLGCVDVLNLDGGGSTTYLAKYEGEGALNLKNNPSDTVERKVSSCLFVTSSALPSGVFDHASLTPNNDVYTPGSEVQFAAVGVDSAGEPAGLPEDGAFALADDSFGAITEDGLFTANDKTGTVEVNYTSGGAVKGTTTIEVQKPDEIYFSDEEVSLGYDETKTSKELSLVVRYQDRDMIIKPGDLIWTTSFDTPSEGDKFEYNNRGVVFSGGEFRYYHSEQEYKKNADGSYALDAQGHKIPTQLMVVLDEALTEADKANFYPTILGTFNGNDFTSAPGNTVNGTITATSAFNEDLTASIHAVIGRLPVVVEDFEGDLSIGRWAFNANGGMLQWESAPGDYDLVTGHYFNNDGTTRGGMETAETVDVDSGEPVRFGNQSLKLNYDFSNINGIEGACVGFTEQSQPIPGNPTGIGLWLYNPEGGRNFWLRIRLLDGNDNILTLDFTKQKEGINWFGWKYVECDLTTHQGPFKLLGGETIRVMHTYSAYDSMGDYLAGTVTTAGPNANSVKLSRAACKGSVYVDNLQFVYGANNDDVDNPVIDSMSINNEPLESGKTVVNTSDVSLNAYVSDVQNKYTTGVDYSVLRIYVDGVNHTYDKYPDGTDACVITEGDGRIDLYNLKLADGDHSMTILVRDKFGNENSETRYFTVDTAGASDITNVTLAPVNDPVLGQNFELELKASDISKISAVSTKVKIDDAFKNYSVVYGDGFEGTSSYNSLSKEISLDVAANGEAKGDVIAKLVFPIDASSAQGTQFTYSVADGQFTMSDDSIGSFACAPKYLPVVAAYNIAATAAIVGKPVTITVTDREGNPAADVNIKRGDDVIGTTDANGELTTDVLTASVAKFEIFAEKDGARSFNYQVQSVSAAGKADGTPFSLMITASKNSETEKNFTWLSNPDVAAGNAVVQYARKADYEANGEAAFQNAVGTAKLVDFLGSADVNNNCGSYLNTVVVSGLDKGTEYVYRAGDGEIFSPVYTFKTLRNGTDVNFFIIGDTQTTEGEIENIQAIQNCLATDGTDYDFGAQLGDFVEKGNMYADWEDILTAYDVDAMKTMDQLHVNGNHEAFGYDDGVDVDDIFSTALFNMPNGKYYSAEYGNTYVAVIGYTNSETVLQNCLDWLKEDAAKTTCQWKILLTHQPAYGTNAASMDTEHFTTLVPPVLEELGFDFMFSGHDHAYARTEPLTGGEVDPYYGVVYYVCGSTGEKSYTATDMPSHHNAVCTQDYDNGIYLTVETTDKDITVTTKEANGSILDTYTKTRSVCMDDGHKFVYTTDGFLTCSVCGYTRPVDGYTGFATDEATGKNRYFTNGEAKTGWLNYGEDCYYFGEDGLPIAAGELTIRELEDTVTYTFDEEGKQVGGAFVKTAGGYTRCYRGGSYLTSWNTIDGKTYFFSTNAKNPGKMLTGKTTIKIFTGQEITYNFDKKDGHLLDYVWVTDEAGTRYYWAQDPVTGWQEIDGKTYYFDEATALMATDEATIDGVTYAFFANGQLAHEGAHDYGEAKHQEACVNPATDTYTCSICGNKKVIETGPATGKHTDSDGNKLCDVCGKYTGNVPNWLEPLFRFFFTILDFFRKLFTFQLF